MNNVALSSQLIQFAASSMYSFLLIAIVIETTFKLLKIRNYRFLATARMLLPIKLVLDPLYFIWPKKWMLVNVNIFGCAHPLQSMLFRKFCGCCESQEQMFGLNTMLENFLLKIPKEGHLFFITLFLGYPLFRLFKLCAHYLSSRFAFRSIMKTGKPLRRPIENIQLARRLNMLKVTLIASDRINIPFAGFGNVIVMPKGLLHSLSQSELETIISHELEHLSWKDSTARFFCRAVSAFYWWIPFGNWFRTIEHNQELACDQSINRYRFSGLDLASALQKALKRNLNQTGNCPAFVDSLKLSGKESLFERFRLTLHPQAEETYVVFKGLLAAIVIGASTVAIGYSIC